MNGFLVLARGLSDDIPMRLCATREEALEFTRALTDADIKAEAEDVCKVTISEVICVGVVEFREGAPMPIE